MSLPQSHNYADSILNAAQKPEFKDASGTPLIVLPKDFAHHSLEHLLPTPVRKKGTIVLDDAASFSKLVLLHGATDRTVVYCEANYPEGKFKMTAVINDHTKEAAAWRDHVVVFSPSQTEEWKTWFKKDSEQMGQLTFAQFLEENIGDINSVAVSEGNATSKPDMSPTGSQMLEMALNLEATNDVRFKSYNRLTDGSINLVFVNQTDDATAKQMKLFERFTLGVAPFFNGDAYRLDARLRYRVDTNAGTVKFWYELIKPEKVLQDAAEGEVAKIQEELKDYTILFGNPGLKQS